MKKVKMNGKLNLNKKMILKLNQDELGNLKGGWAGSVGARCTNRLGTCGKGPDVSNGWACNDGLAVEIGTSC